MGCLRTPGGRDPEIKMDVEPNQKLFFCADDLFSFVLNSQDNAAPSFYRMRRNLSVSSNKTFSLKKKTKKHHGGMMDFDLLSNNAYRQITIFTIAFTTICFQRWIMLAVWREYLGYHCELVLL